MKKIIIMLLFVFILQFSLVSAWVSSDIGQRGIEVNITNNTITIGGYQIVPWIDGTPVLVTSPELFINKIVNSTGANITCEAVSVPIIINGTYSGVNQTITPGYNYNVNYLMDIPFIPYINQSITNQTSTNPSNLFCISESKYLECNNLQNSYRISWDNCRDDLKENEGFKSNYSTCATSLSTCQSERASATAQVTTLTDEAIKTKNSKWVWGIGGIILGIFGTLYVKGHIGRPKVRNPEGNYNKEQSA